MVELLIASVAGLLADRIGSRLPATVGMVFISTGLLLLGQLGPGSGYSTFVLPMLIIGFGNGLFRTPNNTAVITAVPGERLGIASAILATTRNLGRTLGVVAAVALFAGLNVSTTSAGDGDAAPYLTTFVLAGFVAAAGMLTAAVRGPRVVPRPLVVTPGD